MASIVRIVVDIALGREFDYRVPIEMRDIVRIGSRVVVPFGKTQTTGYVVEIADRSDRKDLKEIISPAGEKPFVDERMLELAYWLGDYYCAPVEQAIRTVLPGAVRRKNARFKKRMFVSLSDQHRPPNDKQKTPKKQAVILDILRSKGGIFLTELTREADTTSAPVHALEKKGLVHIEPASVNRNPLANRTILRTEPLQLMPQQEEALKKIKEAIDSQVSGDKECSSGEGSGSGGCRGDKKIANQKSKIENSRVVLLYGVTGSGKTEVYLQAIDYILKKGKGAIVLVPEISLTPQTVERFHGRFGKRVAVLHSRLSAGERHDEWHRIRDGRADIVIGARSAVFAPVKDLGLIVVDEEHEPSYKQEDAPRYSARDVAVMRGRINDCAVVLGSATPSLESWCNAKTGKYKPAVLQHRADNRKMPVMRVIDMRMETGRSGHAGVFSQYLLTAIRSRLDRAEQTILFLNRRGFATSLICQRCGYVANCGQCSVSYTYHRKDDDLHCHICGGTRKVPAKCPECRNPAFKYTGIGTQRVEAIIRKCFPHAAVQRMDADATRRKDSHHRILGDFRVGKIDILIGTQMIAKGLHFPNVTLVGVVYADLSLHMPDFRAGERTFQLLTQVAGRAGRGEIVGEVIVQTYTPFHPAIQAARRLDYEGFCDQELEFRRELSYPPFTHLICITLKGASEDKVSFSSVSLARTLKKKISRRVIISKSAPAPLARARGLYRYQIMLRCASTRTMTESIKEVLRDLKLPRGVTCSVDVDAMSLL